ncbi:TPA: hypothetical protein DIV55_05150 [Patescibacteria group bacterium]|uniref:Glycosyltransferase 2-like domain-containing protein n=1 Tax=Candidatus Gottesmanbacteria bacterium GW2011_GWA1_43_11 TaxID=1618436 RepID=A0A0G1CLE8_9BACT|nr:MAG: hypothetical protein UV59_C0001G0035 [Candidatus Gottesmanbacteria bacterium GW2011_GWA1_43_11]HCS79096.1 hypothetical protein [Patescibacteria group bacterium]
MSTQFKDTLTVILPTYNERGNINKLIQKILDLRTNYAIPTQVVVVDDNSLDGTAATIRRRYSNNRKLELIVRLYEKGLATAILTGIKAATTNYIAVMDTDFNHDPEVLTKMWKYRNTHQLVIGSRYVSAGGMQNRFRYWLSFLFNLFLRGILQHGVHDNLSGFFLMKTRNLKQLGTNKIFYGFGDYFIRLIYRAKRKKYSVIEIPVFYKNRTYGISKSRFLVMLYTYTLSALRERFSI